MCGRFRRGVSVNGASAATGLAALCALLLCAPSVLAGPVLNDPIMWTNAPSLEGWTNALPYGTELTTLQNPDSYLQITFSTQTVPAVESDTIFTTNVSATGNLQNSLLMLRFNFFAEDVLPLSSMVYLHSSGGNVWESVFNNAATGVWTLHEVSLDFTTGGWTGPSDATQFWNDLADIDRVGITISRAFPNPAQQDFRLDDWEYYESAAIPEPGALSIVAASILSLVAGFRKRLKALA